MKTRLLALSLLFSQLILAQAELVQDLNLGTRSSSPGQKVVFNNAVFHFKKFLYPPLNLITLFTSC